MKSAASMPEEESAQESCGREPGLGELSSSVAHGRIFERACLTDFGRIDRLRLRTRSHLPGYDCALGRHGKAKEAMSSIA